MTATPTPLQILLVDDSPTIRYGLRKQLQQLGHDGIDEAPNGAEALAKTRQPGKRYDLIISDIDMPRMDGLQLTERLRLDGNKVPVIIITADDSPARRNEVLKDYGANAYLPKPVQSELLAATIAAVLAPSPTTPAAKATPSPVPVKTM